MKQVTFTFFACLFSVLHVPMQAMVPTDPLAITTDPSSSSYLIGMEPITPVRIVPPELPILYIRPGDPVVAQEATSRIMRLKERLHNFVRKAVADEWPRTGIKATVWEGVIATSFTALALQFATNFETPWGIAYLAGISNQAIEFLLYVPYDRIWNRKSCLPMLQDDTESATVIHSERAVDMLSDSSAAPQNIDPEDMV